MSPRQQSCYQMTAASRKRNAAHSSSYIRFHEPIRQGEIFIDVHQKKWKLGRSIGVGAFGDVYLAYDDVHKPMGSDSKFVIKVEPHSSGPLFVEMNFYLRVGKEELIEEWKSRRQLKTLGMPHICGFGSHTYKGEKYRFLVLPHYGDDIDKIHMKHSKKFHVKTAFTLASYVLDTLEYIHHCGYVHLDIKAMNMVLRRSQDDPNPVYLLDFGLANRYALRDGSHKAYNPDGRKAEAGTLEFSSRDAHVGATSRRSDLESLGFNLVKWMQGLLPWESSTNPETVAELKEEAMTNVRAFLASAFHNHRPPDVLREYLEYVASLEFSTKPDYDYCRSLFRQGIRDAGFLDDSKLTFESHTRLPSKARKKKIGRENRPEIKIAKPKPALNRKPCSVFNQNSPCVRVTRNLDKAGGGIKLRSTKEFNWAVILAGHPERDLKKQQGQARPTQDNPKSEGGPGPQPKPSVLLNPTPAMKKIMQKRKNQARYSEPAKRPRHESFSFSTNLTPAMEEVIANRKLNTRTLRSSTRRSAFPVSYVY